MQVISRTQVGLVRENNEDALLVREPSLFAVADGMGGYAAGEIASRSTIKAFEAATHSLRHEQEEQNIRKVMLEAFDKANTHVYKMAVSNESYSGMGTTMTALYLPGDGHGYCCHVGDSRLYLFRDDKLEQLLSKKQYVTRFLQAIAPLYRGVYMVNTKQDTCRYIYVPSYFKTMLENNHHAFMSSVREYCRELVHPEYHDELAKLLDYSYIEEQIAAHGSLKMTYQIRDGSRVHLKITKADRSSAAAHELLWIFLIIRFLISGSMCLSAVLIISSSAFIA